MQTCKLSSLCYNSLGLLITYFFSDCSVICHQKGCLPSFFYIVKEIQDRNKSEKKIEKENRKHKHEETKGDGSYCPFMETPSLFSLQDVVFDLKTVYSFFNILVKADEFCHFV